MTSISVPLDLFVADEPLDIVAEGFDAVECRFQRQRL
jgi:hypothetical protein